MATHPLDSVSVGNKKQGSVDATFPRSGQCGRVYLNRDTAKKGYSMITYHITRKRLSEIEVPGHICLCPAGVQADQDPLDQVRQMYSPLKELLAQRNFSGKLDETLTISGHQDGHATYIFLNGLGSGDTAEEKLENLRQAMANAMRKAEAYKISDFAIEIPSPFWFDVPLHRVVQEIAVAAEMTHYHFDQFITKADRRLPQEYTLTFSAHSHDHDEIRAGMERGKRIGHAVNQSRHWGDIPASYMTPQILAEHAQGIADVHDSLSCRVYNEKEMLDMGMGGVMAVSQSSTKEGKFVTMHYDSGHNDAPTIALVGKGVTFDSGGLSLKPPQAMEDMKGDMCGGATVLATMQALAYLAPRVNVHAFVPLAENMPDGNAMRPGDILSFYNGKTAEVRNTDAEGRLLLADALSFVTAHYKTDAIIDIATLTGACLHALGPFYAGMMSSDEQLATRLLDAGRVSGDRMWMLPLDETYKKAIISEVADIRNTGDSKYKAGTITAGFFLKEFVDDRPWAHIDIAGTAFDVPDRSYYRGDGSTGFGVRAFLELITQWQS